MAWITSSIPSKDDWVYARFMEQNTMSARNIIKVIDKDVPKVTIRKLERGQMFRYPKYANDQNIYMKVAPAVGWKSNVVLLATGVLFTDFDEDKEIEVIDAISIQR